MDSPQEDGWITRKTSVEYLADIDEVAEDSSSSLQHGALSEEDPDLREHIGDEDYDELYRQLYDENEENLQNGSDSVHSFSVREEGGPLEEEQQTSPTESAQRRSFYHLRWLIVVIICIVAASIQFSYDIPSALHHQMIDHMRQRPVHHGDHEHSEIYFNLLYTAYSLPNIFLPFFGGWLVDTYGASLALVGFSAWCFIGQLVAAFGVARRMWSIALFGRFLFGVGGETIAVAYSSLLPHWFDEAKFLSTATTRDNGRSATQLSVSLTAAAVIARFGGMLNNFISVRVANAFSATTAMWLGTWLLVPGCAGACAVYFMEMCVLSVRMDGNETVERQSSTNASRSNNGHEPDSELATPLLQADSTANASPSTTEIQHGNRIPSFSKGFWLVCISSALSCSCVTVWNNVAAGILLERDYLQPALPSCQIPHPDQCTLGTLQPDPSFNKPFNAANNDHSCPFVLPTSLNVTRLGQKGKQQSFAIQNLSRLDVDCSDRFWADGCTKDYCHTLKDASEKAGAVMSIPFVLLAVLPPFLDRVIAQIGRRVTISAICSAVLFLVHICLALTSISPIVLLVAQGLAAATYVTAIGPIASMVVPREGPGTAFGVMLSLQNFLYAIFPLVVGVIHELSRDRFIPNVEIFFSFCGFLGTLAGIMLYCDDLLNGGECNRPIG